MVVLGCIGLTDCALGRRWWFHLGTVVGIERAILVQVMFPAAVE